VKLLFVADGRSPIALNWIPYLIDRGHEVHLASIYPCNPQIGLASLTVIPVVFSGAVEDTGQGGKGKGMKRRILRATATPKIRTWLRHQFVPRSLPKAAVRLQALISHLQPDLIHAMRVPYEGMLATSAMEGRRDTPLLISIWGNDFTLHAPASRRLTQLTRQAMQRADALHTDCYRDLRLAREWGFDGCKPAVVLPSGGGIQTDIFYPSNEEVAASPTVINPRGLRAYVRNDTFFQAIPLVLARHPKTRFVCPAMQGQTEAQKWVDSLGIGQSVDLLAGQSRAGMAELFRQAQVAVSVTTHDGTPNTLLELMASGCLPVVGNIESIREWITEGENGLLVDPADPQGMADAICEGLGNPELRMCAQKENARLIAERAEYGKVMGEAEQFYRSLL
jgi:glycosyltransferase involved in cell wall biosynthesis